MTELVLMTPPAPLAPASEHRSYAMRSLAVLEDEVRRLETPGLNLTLSWTVGNDLGGWAVGAFYCFSCARLHRELSRQTRHGAPIQVEDLR